MRKIFSKKPAMTLIELMIYLSITMVLLVVIVDMVTKVAQVKGQTSGRNEISQTARFITSRVTTEIQAANSIVGEYPADQLNLTVNDAAVTLTVADGKVSYQKEGGNSDFLSADIIEVSGIGNEPVFTKLLNGATESVLVKFRMKYKVTNYSQDVIFAAKVGGK